MYDLQFIRNNLENISERLAGRGYTLDVQSFRELDARRRQYVTESEQLKAERNQATAEIGRAYF
jgi:seryl-tRNA synthetase